MRARFALALLPLLCTQAAATPLGNLSQVQAAKEQVLIHTDNQMQLQLSLLNEAVFRIQAGPVGAFPLEGSKAAPIVIAQPQQHVRYTLTDADGYRLLKTTQFALRIYEKPLRLALYKADNQTKLWEELQPLDIGDQQSLQTLTSTADEQFYGGGQQNGHFEFKGKSMEISYSGGWEEHDRPSPAPFVMSSKGYGLLRNSWANGSYDFRSADYSSLNHQEPRFDSYVFVGETIHDVLNHYTQTTGRAPLLPRWAFEYGDADCYNDGDNVKKPGTVPDGWSDGPTGTTPDVIESVAKKYREHDMPGGWILPNDGYGCGYTNLPEVVKGLAKYGFKTGLWTENGVDKIAWEVGSAGSRAQKLDVAWTGQGYQFALDANQAAADGIINNSNARPFIWTVMGWAGIQRYAVTWTGDQSGSWDYIRWHIPTLIGSGLSGQAYATGDVDGIFGGSPETFTRDLQWKSFTPVLMGMSGWAKAERKHPWWFDEPYRSINRNFLKLKMRMTPYMYTTAKQAADTGAPIVRGLMWDFPQSPGAKNERYKYQFMLGRDLLVAPVYRSMAASKGWRKDVYLPQGQWIDYWDGRVVDAPRDGITLDYQVTLETIPLFVRAGAIIPMYPAMNYDGEKAKDVLTFDIYPFGHSSYTLYEDDGLSRDYAKGAFSTQQIEVQAPQGKAGDIQVQVAAVQGEYQGQEPRRAYEFWLHSRVAPDRVELNGKALQQRTLAELAQGKAGFAFDNAQYGVIRVRSDDLSIREPLQLTARINAALPLTATAGYAKAPAEDHSIAPDSLLVLNRPAEESGHVAENMFDGKAETWFRTKRDQSVKTGPHELTLALGERRMIDGFAIAPRNDKHWKYGQIRDFEVYLADNNGDWGKPVYRGSLKQQQQQQRVTFPAKPGRLLRVRVLSTWAEAEADPMVTAANASAVKAYNALLPRQVSPITISELKIFEQPLPTTPPQQLFLADVTPARSDNAVGPVELNRANGGSAKGDGAVMQMNGLKFTKGLGVSQQSRVDYLLKGHWQLLRADLGIDDSCRQAGGLQFQIFGDDVLLYDSGLVQAPAVVKPELDIRGITRLSLRTTGGKPGVCANWANASLLGFTGDTAGAH